MTVGQAAVNRPHQVLLLLLLLLPLLLLQHHALLPELC
jgi:hypothetical protein